MILRKKRKDFEEKEEQYFIKTTTLKFLKKKEKLNYTVCANIYLQYCDLLVAYNDTTLLFTFFAES